MSPVLGICGHGLVEQCAYEILIRFWFGSPVMQEGANPHASGYSGKQHPKGKSQDCKYIKEEENLSMHYEY
jgi:hypothetical protein